ncbi:hypothetical protein CNEO_60067 [Clostridium neonatale]|uniref:Uncharacterized protein n=1 Tax=Clostridium neonatale TaxID=137838 RepID=A0AA86JPE6_9CLOT|nr:hypothetical protein CNEO_60067 [Clostridium neonatale]
MFKEKGLKIRVDHRAMRGRTLIEYQQFMKDMGQGLELRMERM